MRLRTSSRLSRMILCPATTAITAATLYMCTAMAVASTCASTPLLCGDLSPPPAFDATFVTTAGNFTVHSELAWAPLGSARFYTLCRLGYYSQVKYALDNQGAFFRYVPRFVVQWGIASNPAVAAAWADAIIDNDAPLLSNTRGTVAFAAEYDERVQPPVAVNRTTQVFVNLNNSNWRLDKNLFVPFGVVIGEVGMKTFDNIFSGYGQEPDQDAIYSLGFAYLSSNFPLLSYTNAVDIQPSQPWPRSKWPPLAAAAASARAPASTTQASAAGAQSSIEAAVVVFCISALMMLAFAAFRMKRNAVYAQQIA